MPFDHATHRTTPAQRDLATDGRRDVMDLLYLGRVHKEASQAALLTVCRRGNFSTGLSIFVSLSHAFRCYF